VFPVMYGFDVQILFKSVARSVRFACGLKATEFSFSFSLGIV
jgi:hypothetical protein